MRFLKNQSQVQCILCSHAVRYKYQTVLLGYFGVEAEFKFIRFSFNGEFTFMWKAAVQAKKALTASGYVVGSVTGI